MPDEALAQDYGNLMVNAPEFPKHCDKPSR